MTLGYIKRKVKVTLRLLSDCRLSDRTFYKLTFTDLHRDIRFPDQFIEYLIFLELEAATNRLKLPRLAHRVKNICPLNSNISEQLRTNRVSMNYK